MVETFTPAVCGSRSRQRLAIALFAVAALVASAGLGATLGFVGSLVGTRPALIAAAALAFFGALREAGVLRLPLPQSRRQVPERWQYELPLPLWSPAYGAGLGLGFLTFQPVATFWVACAAALALGNPAVAAGCFALYGAGRAFMAVWPRHREPSGPAAVERLVGRASFVPRANAIVLGLAVVLLAVAPAAGASVTSLGRGFDPAADGKTLARARMDSGTLKVLVVPPAPDPTDTVSPANAPALDGNYLAYEDDQGIKVIDWRNDIPVSELDGPYSHPALDYPLLAYIRDDGAHERLVLADISQPNPDERSSPPCAAQPTSAARRFAADGSPGTELSAAARRSTCSILATNERHAIKRTNVWMEANPSVTSRRIVWVEHRPQGSYLRMKWFGSKQTKTLMHVSGRKTLLWTTALTGRTAYVTRWTPSTRKAVVLRVNF